MRFVTISLTFHCLTTFLFVVVVIINTSHSILHCVLQKSKHPIKNGLWYGKIEDLMQ